MRCQTNTTFYSVDGGNFNVNTFRDILHVGEDVILERSRYYSEAEDILKQIAENQSS